MSPPSRIPNGVKIRRVPPDEADLRQPIGDRRPWHAETEAKLAKVRAKQPRPGLEDQRTLEERLEDGLRRFSECRQAAVCPVLTSSQKEVEHVIVKKGSISMRSTEVEMTSSQNSPEVRP